MKKYLAHDPWICVLTITFLCTFYIPNLAMAQAGLGAASVGRGGISLGSLDPLWALWNDLSGLKLPPNATSDSLLTHDCESPPHTKPQEQWRWQGKGHSFLLLASVTPQINDAKKLRFQLQMSYQYAQYIGEKSTGSGLNERLGNQHHTLKGQVIMYWK